MDLFMKSNDDAARHPVDPDKIHSIFAENAKNVEESDRFPSQAMQSIRITRPSEAIDDQQKIENTGNNREILSPSHYQWNSGSATEQIFEEEVEMTEKECKMRIAALQKQIEILKLDIDRNHDKLRSLGDYEEPVVFMKELVGGNRWAIEGMAVPHCTETMVDCGDNDDSEVSVRDCHGDIQFSAVIPVKIKIEGRCRRICISRSTHLYLTVESCSLELVLTKCKDITIICGGHPPKIIAEDTHGVTISLCFQLMIESIVQLRCSNISIHSCDRRGIP
jgi:hypothetical protein